MNSNLQKYIEKRLSKLNLYYNRIVSVDLYLNLDNQSSQANKSVELRVNIPGDDDSFEPYNDYSSDLQRIQLNN